jgi:hypothetical protein
MCVRITKICARLGNFLCHDCALECSLRITAWTPHVRDWHLPFLIAKTTKPLSKLRITLTKTWSWMLQPIEHDTARVCFAVCALACTTTWPTKYFPSVVYLSRLFPFVLPSLQYSVLLYKRYHLSSLLSPIHLFLPSVSFFSVPFLSFVRYLYLATVVLYAETTMIASIFLSLDLLW